MKLSNKLNAVIAPLALAFTAATVAPAFAHHVETTDAFSCKTRPSAKELTTEKLAEKVYPATVSVNNYGKGSGRMQRPGGAERPSGAGSGVIIDTEKGYIVTNNHVVEGAKKVTVNLYDPASDNTASKEYEAKVIGTDPSVDIAIVQISGQVSEPIACAPFAAASSIKAGQRVLAVGGPAGLVFSLSEGIISHVKRTGILPDSPRFQKFLQTDAAMNPGNSGGPLFNMKGEIAAINTAIFSLSGGGPGGKGGSNGLGFSVRTEVVRTAANDLIRKGEATHGWLGVAMKAVDDADVKKLGLDKAKGVLVESVADKGPAAGILKAGDLILKVAGHEVNRPDELATIIGQMSAKSELDISLLRNGKEMTSKVTLGDYKDLEKMQNQESQGPGPDGQGPDGQGPEDGFPPFGQGPEGIPPFGQGPQGQMPGQGNGGNNFYFAPGSNPQFFMAPGAAPQGLQQAPRGGQQLPPGFFGQPDGPGEGAPEFAPGPYGEPPQGQPQLPPGSPFPEEGPPQQKAPRTPPAWALPQP